MITSAALGYFQPPVDSIDFFGSIHVFGQLAELLWLFLGSINDSLGFLVSLASPPDGRGDFVASLSRINGWW